MALATDAAIAELDDVLAEVEPTLHESGGTAGTWARGTAVDLHRLRTRCVAVVRRLSPAGSAYREKIDALNRGAQTDVFSDFLDMASDLLHKGFKVPLRSSPGVCWRSRY
jgi:hypothetical protein